MKNIQNKLMVLFFIALAFPFLGFAQDNLIIELDYEVNRIYPYISITKEKLNEAHSLNDLNPHFKPTWVREYISVEVFTSHKGKVKKAVSKNDTLSLEQKNILNLADVGTDISVMVQYIPENTLKHNDPKEFGFTFKFEPESEAQFPGGQQKLKQYLKEKAIDNIPDSSFNGYELAAVKFTISEEGEIVNAHVFESVYQTYNNEIIEKLLLETIRNMPCWKPAEYSDGTKVKQDFVLTVGNMESCIMPLLNTPRD